MEDNERICKKCHKPMKLEDKTGSSCSWVCENGHHEYEQPSGGIVSVLGADQRCYQSENSTGERPAHEAVDYSDFCDRTGGWEEERTPKGTVITQRGTEPRESSEDFEMEAEIQAVQRFLPEYNNAHSTDYESPKQANEHDPPDFTACSRSGHPPLHVEHTRIAKGDQPFGPLHENAEVEVAYKSGEELRRTVLQAIEKKESKYECRDHSDWVLLLDARLPMSEERLTELASECAEELRESGFREIWYVDRAPSPVVRRLK